jgi:fructose-1,6-bisphosphatase II
LFALRKRGAERLAMARARRKGTRGRRRLRRDSRDVRQHGHLRASGDRRGIKDNAPGIFKGEQLGTWLPGTTRFDVALDPIDGTTNIAKGAPNSISCIAAAIPHEHTKSALKDIPSFYMKKLAYGPEIVRYMLRNAGAQSMMLNAPISANVEAVAEILKKRVQDVVVLVMDRPRHESLVKEIRATGAALRMISDGDIAAAIAPSIPDSGVDLFTGIGGSPEAVLASAALKCLGGGHAKSNGPAAR